MHKNLMTASAMALALAIGCGDDDPSPTPNPTDAGVVQNDGGPAATDGGVESQTIVDIAVGNEDFSTLVAAVTRADLAGVLAGDGPFTVFAPNNAAFEASGITDVEAIPVDDLRQILLYHVLGANVPASEVTAGPVDSAASLTVFIGTEGGVTLNGGNAQTGGANVTATDISASNGVIHVIDRVILPPNIPTAAAYGGLTGLLDAVGAAANIDESTTVAAALSGDGPFTVFAPTNAAFAALSETPDADTLRDVVLHHVVGAAVPSSELPAMAPSLLQNQWGNPITLFVNTEDGVAINGAEVEVTDIRTTNGIVHLIDRVILPPNVVDMAGIAGFTALLDTVGAAAPLEGGTTIAEALAADAPYTVFAPTNDAFTRAPDGLDAATVRSVLLAHVVNAGTPVLASGIPASAESLLGQDLTFDASATPPTVAAPGGATGEAGAAQIVVTDINVTNGVIHVIDQVLLPGS